MLDEHVKSVDICCPGGGLGAPGGGGAVSRDGLCGCSKGSEIHGREVQVGMILRGSVGTSSTWRDVNAHSSQRPVEDCSAVRMLNWWEQTMGSMLRWTWRWWTPCVCRISWGPVQCCCISAIQPMWWIVAGLLHGDFPERPGMLVCMPQSGGALRSGF